MKKSQQSLDIYSFQEALLAGLKINRKTGTATLEFNAVPLRLGHPAFSQARLTENRRKGLLYSNEDARNVDLECSGCTFHTVSWDTHGQITESEKRFDLNNSIDRFQATYGADGTQTIELDAEDVRLVMTCNRIDVSKARTKDE